MLESIGIATAGTIALTSAVILGAHLGEWSFRNRVRQGANLMVLAAAHNDLVAGIEAMEMKIYRGELGR